MVGGGCGYPGAEQGVEDVVWCSLSSPLQNLGQEQELKHRNRAAVSSAEENQTNQMNQAHI